MKRTKKLLALCLILSLLLGIFAGTATMAVAEPAGDYTVATEFVAGNRYIIAAEYEGSYYALSFDGELGAEAITVNGDAVSSASDAVKWTAGEDGTIESVHTAGNFIFAGSGGFMVYESGRAFVYDAANSRVIMHTKPYYLTFDGTTFSQSTDEADACTVVIFEKDMSAAGAFTLANAFTAGKGYVIAAEYEGSYYALSFDGELGAEAIEVTENRVIPDSAAIQWFAGEDDTIESAHTAGNFIFAGSGGFMVYNSGRAFVYDAENQRIVMHTKPYYLTFDGTAFSQSTDEADACTVVIFEGEIVTEETEESDEPAGKYVLANSLTYGDRYIIVAEHEGESYAFSFASSALCAIPVTVDNDGIEAPSDDVKWQVAEDDTIESVGTPGTFVYAGSYGLMTYESGRSFVYDAENHHIVMHTKPYYLTFDGTTFSQSTDEADACDIKIYVKDMPVVEPDGDYTLTNEFVLGDRYIITTEYEGTDYAFAFSSSALCAIPVTVDGDAITAPSDEVKWQVGEDDTVENVGTPGTFIYAGSYGLMTYDSGRAFVYDAENQHIVMHTKPYYLTFDGTAFNQSTDVADACTVKIYGKDMPTEGSIDRYIPDGSDLPSVVRDSVKNPDGTITLAFASDLHHSLDYEQNNLQVWLENLEASVAYIDAMGFCGDMGSAYSATPEEYWANTQALIDYMDTQIADGSVGNTVYTFGNHEWYPSAGGDFMNTYENPTAKRLLRVGEGMKTDDYIIYCLGAGSMASNHKQGYSDEDIDRIAAYLASAPSDIPIFVLTHFPIHAWEDRITDNAAKLLNVLNGYPNVVVLWGHNHSNFDNSYDIVLRAGDSIVLDAAGTLGTLNFTYLSAGCISDAEYTGVSGGSAWVQGKGLVVTIETDGTVNFSYYTMDGKEMKEDGPFLVEFRNDIDYEIIKSEYVEPGQAATPPEMPDKLNYTFAGWDTDLSSITRHCVVTGSYDYVTNLDPAYAYFTVQDNGTVAVGKSGTPLLLYKIPYVEGMTVLDALQQLQDAELDGESTALVVNEYGAIMNFWGYAPDNGTWTMAPQSSTGYVYTTDDLTPGGSYYITALDGDAFIETSYLAPFDAAAKIGYTISMYAESWVFDINTYGYTATALDGEVLVGTSLDNLESTGITAVDGEFEISFDDAGTYYVAVQSDHANLAITKVTVTRKYLNLPAGNSGGSKPEDEKPEDEKPEEPAPSIEFIDVDEDSYYSEAVAWAVENGITDGTSENTFSPNMACTRAQMVTFLWRAAGRPTPAAAAHGFDDVRPDSYYNTAVIWAVENGITDGTGEGTFSPDKACTRAQMVTFLFRYAGTEIDGSNPFTDVAADAYYAEAVYWAFISGITDGTGESTFSPELTCTRGQMVTFLFRQFA